MFKNLINRRFFSSTNGVTQITRKFELAKLPSTPTVAQSEQHLKFLSQYYSPQLLESIKITESLISPEQYSKLKQQDGKFAVDYLDDFSKYDQYWDFAQSERKDYLTPHQPDPVDIPAGSTLPETNFKGRSAQTRLLARDLARLTGLNEDYIAKLYVRPLIMKRVSNQTGKGKIASFYSLVIVGDKNGMVGIGEGKSRQDGRTATRKAHWNAVKNLTKIPRFEDRTILADIEHKYHACKLFLRSAPPGSGLRVNHYIFEVCEAAGIKDLSAKVYRSRNGMNIIKGVVEALSQQKSLDELALNRGKKIVDLRKTYYSQ